MHLWDCEWECRLSQDGAGWRAEVYRNSRLAAWYDASTDERARAWASALLDVFRDARQQQ